MQRILYRLFHYIVVHNESVTYVGNFGPRNFETVLTVSGYARLITPVHRKPDRRQAPLAADILVEPENC